MLDVRKLRMLAELDRLGTIAAVARSLNLTAPGVSMQIAALEREVGVPLTERSGRNVVVTPAGRVLARHGQHIVDMVTVAEMDARALREGAAGTYRIAAFPTAARSFVADAWGVLLRGPEHGLTLRVVETEPRSAAAAVSAGEADLAVTHAYTKTPDTPAPGLVTSRIAGEEVWLAVREDDPALPDGEGAVDLGDFARHDWAVSHQERSCHEMVYRACGRAGFEPRPVAEATDFATQLALVGAGACVALIPRLGCVDPPAGVVFRALSSPVHRYVFLVARHTSRSDPGLRRLRAVVTDAARRVLPGEGPGLRPGGE